MLGFVHAFALATLLLSPPAPTQNMSSALEPCPRTCMRAARCCELGCPPSPDINCSAIQSEPIGQCLYNGYAYDLVVLNCYCSAGTSYQTTCGDV